MSIDTTKKIKQVTYNGKEIPLRGYDTSDANVTKHDLPLDITAYGPNGKVEGFVDIYGPNESVGCPFNSMTYNSSNKTITVKGDLGTPIMFRNGCSTTVSVGGDKFGDATAADVAKGKTFTSAAGLKVVGTAAISSGIETVSFRLSNRYNSELWVSFPVVNSSAEENDSVTVTRGTISVGQTVEIEAPANAMITVLGTDRTASDTLTVDKAIPTVNYNGGLTLMSFVALATLKGQTVSISY